MFRNAWNLGKISGIDIRVHWSFLLLPVYVYYMTAGSGEALTAVLLILAIFGCVLLHELGHAFAARSFGIGTRDIIMLPIGGVASLERIPRNPYQELWIAIAGPLVNVVIAAVLFAGLFFSPFNVAASITSFIYSLAIANIFLVVFNMLPAFPMDGGRVLRATLALFMPYVKATTIAATIGKYCALAFGIYGLFYWYISFILLAIFVYLAGQAEKMQVVYGDRFRRSGRHTGSRQQSPVHGATGFERPQTGEVEYSHDGQKELCVPSTLSADSVVAWLSNVRAECCNIVESGKVIGRVTKGQLLTALSNGMGSLPVGQLMRGM
jgi:Zn-dependent protease